MLVRRTMPSALLLIDFISVSRTAPPSEDGDPSFLPQFLAQLADHQSNLSNKAEPKENPSLCHREGRSNLVECGVNNAALVPAQGTGTAPSERCYILTTNDSASNTGMLSNSYWLPPQVRHAYTRYITGLSFCTSNYDLVDSIKKNYPALDIEDDKIYKIGTISRAKHGSKRGGDDKRGVKDNQRATIVLGAIYRQSPIPTHFYRMWNAGALLFNNYILDNIVFRMLRINRLIKYFYEYDYIYTGNGVKITKLDTRAGKNCNVHRANMDELLTGQFGSFAKNAQLATIEAVECDGTIRLSKLLHTLQSLEDTDILVLPLSGPQSDALDIVVKKISQRAVVVVAAGDDHEDSCNYSPNGPGIIKVGSVTKHGYISTFSNSGRCNSAHALGEDIYGDSGTSYATALIASASALYLEKRPKATLPEIMKFIRMNSMTTPERIQVLSLPYPSLVGQPPVFYSPIVSLLIMLVIYGWLLWLIFRMVKYICRTDFRTVDAEVI